MGKSGVRLRVLILSTVFAYFFIQPASANQIAEVSEFKLEYFLPMLIAFAIAIPAWRWFIPNQLTNLQVAFEIDDDLYEVHKITGSLADARNLLKQGSVGYGIGLYMMGMTGILILIIELLIDPGIFFKPDLVVASIMIVIPVLISPWESLNTQLLGMSSNKLKARKLTSFLRRIITLSLLIGATIATLLYGIQSSPDNTLSPIWLAAGMLTFMSPTILAYGRIMGASWNMLIINKWRTANGRPNPIDPYKPKFFNRLFSLVLVLFLITMPITALNGIVTVFYVLFNKPSNATEVLNFGGIIGHSIYERIDLISELLFHWQFIKALPQFLSLYLSLNIAIVGLAFIFELTRNLILGGQSFGGLFGVTLDSPREIRTEVKAQARQLTFAFAGFSGYTVLLLVLVCYKEFGDLMPFTDMLESKGFDEGNRLLTTWMFIAFGQAIFLFTWLLSIMRYSPLLKLRFDLNPDERREGAVKFAGGDWMRELVDDAAIREDLDGLIQFQRRSIEGDSALVRHEKARAHMWELALRGLWPKAIEEARKVLAQAGGDDDVARMVVAVGHMASRRLDAAREALHGLQQPEGYDEPELLAFVCEWLDPWQGTVTEDDFWDWENNSCIDHLQTLMRMLRGWQPSPNDDSIHNDRLTRVAQLSMISLMRAQRKHDEALELSLKLIRDEPTGVRPRIAASLCLIDKGDWHSARSILTELKESDPQDPRVLALSSILGQVVDEEEMEVALAVGEGRKLKKWINSAPVNAIAGLMVRGGMDEAINANVLIASHEATRRGMPPIYRPSALKTIFHLLVLMPTWIVLGIYISHEIGQVQGLIVVITLFMIQFGAKRFSRQQRRVVRHRDQKALIAYSKRMKRFKVQPERGNIPVGTHLLLSGMLVTVNGVVLDVGLPGWMTVRLPRDSEKSVKARLRRQAKSMSKSRPPRLQPLGEGWWLKRPKEEGADTPVLERLIGTVAYKGRQQYVQKKSGKSSPRPSSSTPSSRPVSDINLGRRGIPTNTRVSERSQRLQSTVSNRNVGSKIPGRNVRPSNLRKSSNNEDDDFSSFK
ncbi:MAG: tetratricopeptide repeat protein [Euryarchaeota archaeon]|nr:tetratricopeptide repeat protein [Euryarchaeota archaeon]MBT5843499.1 tetratricopeptide repeat protein [Euryarchaeota archaeon]MBT6844469.1 tetratricopeptide repeat protein [Euryarchaeota archaeon]MBT7063146.1 tetratricopeptide repeat protein [Euryarchaeota archaeon]MBT7262940.1 tetratricopeptide repeat protein [Euryarchaeota archaeon]